MAGKTTNKTDDREKLTIWLNHDMTAWLRKHQEDTGLSVSEFIRRAIDSAIEAVKRGKK